MVYVGRFARMKKQVGGRDRKPTDSNMKAARKWNVVKDCGSVGDSTREK